MAFLAFICMIFLEKINEKQQFKEGEMNSFWLKCALLRLKNKRFYFEK